MTLIKRRSINPTLPQFFDDFFTRDLMNWGLRNNSLNNGTLPSVNIKENHDHFLVEMAAPGMNKADFHIELDNETLTISSQKEVNNDVKENGQFVRQEFSYQSFQRSFQLSKRVVDEAKIEAKYENGLLRITIPKKEEAKIQPPRQIAIE